MPRTLNKVFTLLTFITTLFLPQLVLASTAAKIASIHMPVDLTNSDLGFFALGLFVFAYLLVMAEEFTNLRKSKPVMLAAGIIWGSIGWYYTQHGMPELAEKAVRKSLLEYAELMLFLLVAMTYVNAMIERRVFDALRSWLINKGFGFRQLFWLTGGLAFFISPVADNLTTALLMCAVVLAVGGNNTKFVSLACINIVIAANAGGAYSPFGDITTLMVWQKGKVEFWEFFALFIPAAVNFLIPASIMHFAVPKDKPQSHNDSASMLRGAKRIIFLFFCTIITAVSFHNFLGLPPVIGMLTGLGYLQFLGYYLKTTYTKCLERTSTIKEEDHLSSVAPFDVFSKIALAEWDTLFFFYGVVLCVGGLGFIGYLSLFSELIYSNLGPTHANVLVGLLSSIIDNIPVMYAVLSMNPDMSVGQWLLVTFTAGVGGSLLSIGSAAGVALMGQAKGKYTFFTHLKWTPVIALGYASSVIIHLWLNARYFH